MPCSYLGQGTGKEGEAFGNENVEADHRCDTKEQRKRNENVEAD